MDSKCNTLYKHSVNCPKMVDIEINTMSIPSGAMMLFNTNLMPSLKHFEFAIFRINKDWQEQIIAMLNAIQINTMGLIRQLIGDTQTNSLLCP